MRIRRSLSSLLVCLIILSPGVVFAGENYAATFTEKADQAYSEDINVWAYTESFAERFGMPEKWISDALTGAYAVAYRVEIASAQTFFPHKGENVNAPLRRCVLDLFLSDQADVSWANDERSGIRWNVPQSPTYLIPQGEADKKRQWRPFGLSSRTLVRYPNGGFLGIQVHAFERKLYSGVDYLSFSMACTEPGREFALIEFRPSGTLRGNKDAVTHTVRLPKRFMKKVYAKWKKSSRKPSLKEWDKVINGE